MITESSSRVQDPTDKSLELHFFPKLLGCGVSHYYHWKMFFRAKCGSDIDGDGFLEKKERRFANECFNQIKM